MIEKLPTNSFANPLLTELEQFSLMVDGIGADQIALTWVEKINEIIDKINLLERLANTQNANFMNMLTPPTPLGEGERARIE